jgi:hypothetical protein
MTAPIPLTLARFLHDMHQRGEIDLTPPAKPSLSDYSARTGVVTQVTWKHGEEPDF